MPETIDSVGSPEFNELPALHMPPASGEGSKKPTDPKSMTGPSPIGEGKAPAPMGSPGAPMGGGKPPMQPQQESPTDVLNKDTLDSLRQDIDKIVKRDELNDIESVVDKLLEEGWKVDRLRDLMDLTDSEGVGELFNKVIEREYDTEVGEAEQAPEPQSAPVEPGGGSPIITKPDNDQTGLNPKNSNESLNFQRSVLMKKAIIKDGTIVVKEGSDDVSGIISGITNARRRVEASLKDYNKARIMKAGLDSLGMGPSMGDDLGSMLGDPSKEDGGLAGALKKLEEAVSALIEALEKGEKIKDDDAIDISSGDMKGLEDEMDKGKDALKDVKDKGPMSEKKDEDKDKVESSEGGGSVKEAGKGSQEAMDVAMGKKGPQKKKEDKEKKSEESTEDGKEVTAEESVVEPTVSEEGPIETPVQAPAVEAEVESEVVTSSESIVDKIITRVAEMKKANLYPFKDLNKQQVDNTNATTAKDQIKAIDSEIKGGKQPSDADKTKAPSISPTDIKTDLKAQKGKISVEAAERIKQHSIDNAVSKARLAVELAARQQLKGLIDNPLKQAFVKNMVEAGLPEDTAEAISHNAFIDGYEDAQKLIIKEAFETFMKKDIQDFIKVAKFTESYTIKEGTETPVEGEDSKVKTASVSGSPLRGTQAGTDRKGDYKKFWETVAYQRKGGEI